MFYTLFFALALIFGAHAQPAHHLRPMDGAGGPPQPTATVSPMDGAGGPPQLP